MIFFDIETGPLPPQELEARKPPFEARKGLKDPAKIKVDLVAKEDAWLSKTTLNAFTSQVWSIAYKKGAEGEVIVDHFGPDPTPENEAGMIEGFFGYMDSHSIMCGFNIIAFDVPFIIRRAYALGVHVPSSLRQRKYWYDKFVDLMDMWTLGTYRVESQNRISLNNLAKHLGLEGKTGTGDKFWSLFQVNQKEALEYAKRDVELLAEIYDKIG
tara:strand:+ start:9017 stop:9655 length:639 start_codon:yes stop_codon:yes gene_type:complete